MADFSNIPTGLKITSQIPLNVKEYCLNESTLSYLGVDDNLAYTYHDGIEILCIEEKTLYKWREVQIGEENTGLIPLDYTYPNGLPDTFGINYSGKTYNFFLVDYVTSEDIESYLETFINLQNVGTGAEIYKEGTRFDLRTIVSETLTITSTDDEISIETPMTAAIPALYVNNLYIPTEEDFLAGNTKGEGTLAKPFTDTVTAYVAGVPTITANTAIQNALDAYVGSGTRLSPEKVGQKIIVQDNNSQYNFPSNFGYSRLNIEVNANILHTDSGKLFDMDNATHFNALQDSITITIGEGYFITLEGDGIYNSGSNVATNNLSQSRTAFLKGSGTLYFPNNNIIKYGINSDETSLGNNNDGSVTFSIECNIRADYQGVYRVGGNSRIFVYGKLISGVSSIIVDTALEAFLHLGGQVRFFEGSEILFTGARINGFTFTPTSGFIPEFVGNSPTLQALGSITNMFNKTNNTNVNFTLIDSQSGVLLDVINIFESTNLWEVRFKNNNFESGSIDFTKVDLTVANNISSTNTIGNNIIESLTIHDDRAAAILAGRPLYSAYLKTSGVAYPSTAGWVRDIVLPA